MGLSRSFFWKHAWAIAAVTFVVLMAKASLKFFFTPGHSWWIGYDQSLYLKSAIAWSQGNLDPAQHFYPPGYALLAAPFAGLAPNDPFIAVNLASYVACFALFLLIARELGISAIVAVLLFGLTTYTAGYMRINWVTPWTTTPAAVITYGVLAASLIGIDARPRTWPAITIGLLCGLILLVRPTDVVGLAPPALAWLAFQFWRGGWRAGVRAGLIAGCAFALALALVVAIHVAVHGWAPSAYMTVASNIGFAFEKLVTKWIVIVATPRPLFETGRGIVTVFPFVIVGFAGVLYAVVLKRFSKAAVVGWSIIATFALYLAFADLQPSGLWDFLNIHYFKAAIPLLALMAWLWAKELVVERRFVPALATLLIAALTLSFKLEPVALPATTTANGRSITVTFDRPTSVDGIEVPLAQGGWDSFHVAEQTVIADGRPLTFLGEYRGHVIAGGGRIHFFRRLSATKIEITLGNGNEIDSRRPTFPFKTNARWRWF